MARPKDASDKSPFITINLWTLLFDYIRFTNLSEPADTYGPLSYNWKQFIETL